jgi:hypothetical protein
MDNSEIFEQGLNAFMNACKMLNIEYQIKIKSSDVNGTITSKQWEDSK